MFRDALSTTEIMSRFANNCEVDLRINLTVLKAQVNIIRLSKNINHEQLKEITGANDTNIKYILQNQQQIMEKWKKLCQNALSNSHSDDCEGIDVLLLKWISQYKIKPPPSAIKTVAMNIADILNIFPYFITPGIWKRIDNIYDESNVIKSPSHKRIIPLSIVDILKKNGSQLLTAQTYKRFMNILEKTPIAPVNIGRNTETVLHNDGFEIKKPTSTIILDIIPSASSAVGDSENEDFNVIKIKEEPLEYTGTDTEAITLSTGQIKKEIADDHIEEFISIKQETEDKEYTKIMDDNDKFISIKIENDLMDVKNDFTDKSNNVSDPEIHKQANKEDPMKEKTANENNVRKHVNKLVKKNTETDSASKSNIQVEMEQNKSNIYQEIKIERTSISQVNIIESENSPNVKYEMKDTDHELKEEPHEGIHKYSESYSIKEVNGTQYDDDAEVFTVLEIVSDDGEADIKSNIELDKIYKIISDQHPKNLKRTKNEIEDDLPSTSQSMISNSHINLSHLSKKLCKSYSKLEDLNDLSIHNRAEALDFLHSIKRYLLSQNDSTGVKLINKIMMSFILSDDIYGMKSS